MSFEVSHQGAWLQITVHGLSWIHENRWLEELDHNSPKRVLPGPPPYVHYLSNLSNFVSLDWISEIWYEINQRENLHSVDRATEISYNATQK